MNGLKQGSEDTGKQLPGGKACPGSPQHQAVSWHCGALHLPPPLGSPSKGGIRMHDPQHWELVTFLYNQ